MKLIYLLIFITSAVNVILAGEGESSPEIVSPRESHVRSLESMLVTIQLLGRHIKSDKLISEHQVSLLIALGNITGSSNNMMNQELMNAVKSGKIDNTKLIQHIDQCIKLSQQINKLTSEKIERLKSP